MICFSPTLKVVLTSQLFRGLSYLLHSTKSHTLEHVYLVHHPSLPNKKLTNLRSTDNYNESYLSNNPKLLDQTDAMPVIQ